MTSPSKTATLTTALDRTTTPQAAAGVPDHSTPFLLAGKYSVPYLSLSFRESEAQEEISLKIQRMSLEYTQLTVQEQLDKNEEFDERGRKIRSLSIDLWVKILKRRMKESAPSEDEFLDNVGPSDAEALMRWLEGKPQKVTAEE